MALFNSYQYCYFPTLLTIIALHLLLLLLLSPVSCFNSPHPAVSPGWGSLFEGKSRLGSIPPSCHNKCNECQPCMAVQVPSLPNHDRVHPGLTRKTPLGFSDPSTHGNNNNNRYSNYKPLGWKCHCGNHFFNP
ncbi:hypothetical protein L6164_025166 [Bauhinia variegata]|uniref:Uncharacterized protein n=1 Tax=Bauhinia variegata TaxID=167791 RepID=A0ACB9M052_BAUVA|nr:hypothetical protein L6164_025166 [Bauhinia variegata]